MLGKLEKITDLRSIWKHEAIDFTNWLAKEENMNLLGDEIGIELSLVETEASVGGFNVDILAEENSTGKKVIVENQLEMSDHDHLGKILTYASGYDAEIIVWVLKDIREEHLQAVSWLNENTTDKINFFVVKIELWKIDESPVAVKFNVVARPNDWTKSIRSATSGKHSDTQLMQLDFWNAFKEYALEQGTKLKLRKTQPQHWYDVAYGVAGSHLGLTINSQQKVIGVEVYIDDSKELYHRYYDCKEEIESRIGFPLEWMELPSKKASRIKLSKEADFTVKDDWNEQFKWMNDSAEAFAMVFKSVAKDE